MEFFKKTGRLITVVAGAILLVLSIIFTFKNNVFFRSVAEFLGQEINIKILFAFIVTAVIGVLVWFISNLFKSSKNSDYED